MSAGVIFEDGEYGLRAVLTGPWSETTAHALREKPVAEIDLNYAEGWRGSNLSFVSEFARLQSLRIIDWRISSIDPIHCLHNLRRLKVFTYCKTGIRFSEFPQLEDCAIEWRARSSSMFDCVTLKKLFVNRYKGKDTAPFGRLVNLESLGILNAPIGDLHGLSMLKNLRCLRLAGLRCLDSLGGIEELTELQELDINTCRRIGSIDEIGCLPSLLRLHVNNCGDIESLKPLDRLSRLEFVSFYESTNIVDKDLSPLTRQKNLAAVTFQNRSHYSHRREDFRQE